VPVENYKPLSCDSFGFLSLLAAVDAPKKKRGGARPGAGRKPVEGSKFYFIGPKSPKFCKTCNAAFFGRGSGCNAHKGGKCTHEKPIFSNGKQRLACFACDPKPEKTPRKPYEFKSKKDSACECCGLMFEKTQHHNKFCSDVCRNRTNNVSRQSKQGDRSERACRCCGVFFTPEYGVMNKLQCSSECLEKFHKDQAQSNLNARMRSDPVLKLSRVFRTFICKSIIRGGYKKTSKSGEILGCTWEFFKTHIERQFHPGMTWEGRSDWHIDHIRPISSAENESDVVALNHFTNLRPMWAKDNMSKGAKQTHLI